MRFAAIISYDGTNYQGWQSQPHSDQTIQTEIEQNLSKILRDNISIIGCGRTDSGVHARGYVFHFDNTSEIDCGLTLHKLNKMLSPQIVVKSIWPVHDTFHARFDALSRSYNYQLTASKSPFNNRFAWEYLDNVTIDIEILNETAALFLEVDDFFPFCKTRTDVKTTLCKVIRSEWTYDEERSIFSFNITADRFLRGMIRLMVGACLNVNRNKLTIEEIKNALAGRTRLKTDWSVPAKGLTLYGIKYPYVPIN